MFKKIFGLLGALKIAMDSRPRSRAKIRAQADTQAKMTADHEETELMIYYSGAPGGYQEIKLP